MNYFFGEDQARYLIEIDNKNLTNAEKILKDNNIFYENIGYTQYDYFEIEDEFKMQIKDLFKINNEWYNNYLCPYLLKKLKNSLRILFQTPP